MWRATFMLPWIEHKTPLYATECSHSKVVPMIHPWSLHENFKFCFIDHFSIFRVTRDERFFVRYNITINASRAWIVSSHSYLFHLPFFFFAFSRFTAVFSRARLQKEKREKALLSCVPSEAPSTIKFLTDFDAILLKRPKFSLALIIKTTSYIFSS